MLFVQRNKMSLQSHPEWTKENSLTAPSDRDRTNVWRPEQSEPPLTREQGDEAYKALNNDAYTRRFPRIDRTYADPPLSLQNIGLISFTPAKGATPNDKGVYGFAKLRGNFGNSIEANQRAEELIRNYDSYHQIYHTYVGRPFPLTLSSDYSAETEEIDIRREQTRSISSSVRDKQKEEQRNVKDIQEREQKLLKESDQDPEDVDPYETYITLRVKKAQLIYTYLEHREKLEEVKKVLIKTRKEVDEMDKENPDYKDKYYDKFMEARRQVGVKETPENAKDNFIKYMVEDVDLGF